ncbi:peptidoglycan editing factor PgeF [Bacillus sp. Marseille-Q3570]|uniref:peptidoglycan editing factor PgeF n=1 Tax=Bacillus sp. Marseille-Q3570 TaxID=2963522 RepID=UPI0021B75BB9|nr:peptidoglycan editing factor PgeF [Bacillus sp. Marseille-Q3570]
MSDPFILGYEMYYKINKLRDFTNNKVTAGFSTRHGGVSQEPFQSLNLGLHVKDVDEDVIDNRMRLAEAIDTQLDQWVFADQVHGSEISKVKQTDKGKGSKSLESGIIGMDGLYTRERDLVLALAYADCVPIFFLSEESDIVGIAHAGWKGSVKGIAARMVDTWVTMEEVAVDSIHVFVGPSIQECCYEVDERVITQVDDSLDDEDPRPYTAKGNSKYQLNLQHLNKQLLIRAGVPEKNVHLTKLCTSCNIERFFSHRKENGATGRMLGFIMLKQ